LISRAPVRRSAARGGTGPPPVAWAPGSDGLVQNRRAAQSGTAASATTGFGSSAHPATSVRERSRRTGGPPGRPGRCAKQSGPGWERRANPALPHQLDPWRRLDHEHCGTRCRPVYPGLLGRPGPAAVSIPRRNRTSRCRAFTPRGPGPDPTERSTLGGDRGGSRTPTVVPTQQLQLLCQHQSSCVAAPRTMPTGSRAAVVALRDAGCAGAAGSGGRCRSCGS
jgi:hypothetical protein